MLYQLEIASALTGCAVISAACLYLNWPTEGKIQLPVHVDDDDGGEDPFDVTRAEDVIDGYPIEAEAFWRKSKRRKFFLALLFAAVTGLQAASLGLSVFHKEENSQIITYALYLAYALYSFGFAVFAVKGNDVQSNSERIWHLCALSTIPALSLAFIAILPSNTIVISSNTIDQLWYGVLAVYILASVVSWTTPLGPALHYPPDDIYSPKTVATLTNTDQENVTGVVGCSPWDMLFFSYTTKVVMLGNTAESLEIADLPIVPGSMRATYNYSLMKTAMRTIKLRIASWKPAAGSGALLAYRLLRLNAWGLFAQFTLAATAAVLFYAPPFFLRMLLAYLETDPNREDPAWGWVWVASLFATNVISYLLTGQLWSLSTTTLQVRFRIQLNSILYAKTLVRKDVASSASTQAKDKDEETKESDKKDEDDFSSKAQIMTLMTTDVDRVSEFAWHLFTLIDSPIEIVVGSIFLYKLLGISCLFGLAVTCLFLPMNHFAGKVVVNAQDNLMKARDERVALMNEILGAIRMLKFMAWERSFEARVLKIRAKELKYQKLNYTIEVLWNAIWNGSPMLVTLVSFWHYAVVRKEVLTPSVAFTSIIIFNEMKFALNALPETLINMLQSLVSLRRIEKYLNTAEVTPVPPLSEQSSTIAFQSCTVTWPQDRNAASASATPSAASTPRHKFILVDLSLQFPPGQLSLVCGKLGSGKTLLLLALLGEADILSGQMLCPRSPPNALAEFAGKTISKEQWIVSGMCAFVPQAAWLRNASIKENILFNLPYDEERYHLTLEVCALVSDLEIIEDGDEAEIGERGVNLSGGQKARVSLARAVYSRASILLLDDVLSAVDAHTAQHLYNNCLRGELMKNRTVILVSHHVQLCAPGAAYIVALDNGRVQFKGDKDAFQSSGVMSSLVQSTTANEEDQTEAAIETSIEGKPETEATTSTIQNAINKKDAKAPRKLIEEEKRAVGRVARDVWATYIQACGASGYWAIFVLVFVVAALGPVVENGWVSYWSRDDGSNSAVYYISIYAILSTLGLILTTVRWFVLYRGSIHASTVLYKRLLEGVLFAKIRFHDTVSRGRVLNRFGKDFEGIDSNLSDNFGRSTAYLISSITTIIAISVVGGVPFIIASILTGIFYYNAAKVYGQTSRDMRRLDSVTRSPLYSMYSETIAGVAILRAFGASSKFLRDMLRCVDTNSNPYYWMWGVNRWLSIRFNILSSGIMGAIAFVAVFNGGISAALAGFALAFANTITNDLLFLVRRFVGLEQSMVTPMSRTSSPALNISQVALERVKEYSELDREAPEFVEPRPDPTWPSTGAIRCEDLVIRYAPELPPVLHNLNFEIKPGEKVGILGRTGSGKSTLALSFFRFVEPTEGRIVVDGLDISKIGLSDLRSRITIIPQDPTILSGTLRSTLDVFDEYQDADIFEALRRVHLIPSSTSELPENEEDPTTVNVNMFRNLDSAVSEGGENFSTGEKQLLCMARAILKRSRILVMDEATASVDYATDELIGRTIRQEFAESTILTIAHRLRTVIDYDRVMLLDQGKIVEFDSPGVLLKNSHSKFHALCKATGKQEFATLKKLAGI
ncbi:Multidrug resistance-associated ABC transporter protein [Mycena indigotica]|uniref:Multidrug resistance-associated ABC transporter protein n=1 Tax=Mycena indigotica TaxID=2126181 RepID=A0A8H6WGU2_9AGAR|nr:Multidrug resistance-associated ABC transporter protein [Mycena indigotica]KAF7316261.1 Multidrug resistance-associated ABC transporter protein [Mycena indigotica]